MTIGDPWPEGNWWGPNYFQPGGWMVPSTLPTHPAFQPIAVDKTPPLELSDAAVHDLADALRELARAMDGRP